MKIGLTILLLLSFLLQMLPVHWVCKYSIEENIEAINKSLNDDSEEKNEKGEKDDSQKEQKFVFNQQLGGYWCSCLLQHQQKSDIHFYNTPVLDKLTPPPNRVSFPNAFLFLI